MLSLLRRSQNPTRARIPPGRRVYAVGDIHGRSDLLADLHLRIAEDIDAKSPARRTIVYLGDYVDRGPGSSDVIDMLLNDPLEGFEAVHLKGNHEEMMLDFLTGPPNVAWLFNGGDATLLSYGVPSTWSMTEEHALEELRQRLEDALPIAHLDFLKGLDLQSTIGGYLFVHAGIRPGVPLGEQRPTDLVWIRDRFLESKDDFGARVVHGHTITMKPAVRPNRIGIDTGAYYSGRLTCLVLEDDGVRFLST